jgi:hypothetical protein
VLLNADGLITLERKAVLKPYQPRSFVEREFLTDAELLSHVGGTLFLNVESYPNYFLITFKLHNTNKFLQLECGEGLTFNPKLLSWIMFNYRTVGFNSINYDLLILWLAYREQDATLLKRATEDVIIGGIREWELKKTYQFQTFNTNHIDLIEVAPLKGSLKLYGARLHTGSIQDQPFDVDKELTEFEISELKQFNCNQLDITEELFNFMKERLDLRESLGNEYHENLMSKSDAQIAEVILVKEVAKLNGKRPSRQDVEPGTVFKYSVPHYIDYKTPELKKLLERIRLAKFTVMPSGKMDIPEEVKQHVKIGSNGIYRLGIGGLHSSEETVSYKSTDKIAIVDRDVASYYPRLITTLGLYPASCGPNFLTAYNHIIDVRLDAKARKIFSRDKGLKIVINGTSGKLSDVWSTFYSPDNTIQMTVSGQLALLMFVELLEQEGIKVVSANTDGIVMLVPLDKENTYEQIYKHWENISGFTTEETRYKSYYARDVNAYFAVKLDGKVKKKGNPYAEVGSQSGTQLDVNPTVQICSDAVEALLSKGVPIEQTIRECKNFTRFVNIRQAKAPGAHKNGEYLGRVLRWYYAKGELGCIQTVAANNKVADSDGAKPVMDMPATFPTDIDYQWYIDFTKGILEDIGYLARPKQISFF